MRYPGFLTTFGSRLGAGLADELLDRWFPPPPSLWKRFAQAFVDQAPVIVSMVQYYLHTKDSPKHEPTIPATPIGVAPGCFHPLGEFTCPKCGGHTWGTLGSSLPPTVERYCTNGLETAYGPGMNPNTVEKPCMFQWLSSADHLYFTKPSAEEAKPQTCAPPKAQHLADWDRGVDWGRPVLGLTGEAVEHTYGALAKAIGDRFENPEESLCRAAARLIAEADAFIKNQADKIADLMLDNAYPAGKGEIGFMLSEAAAKKLGLAYSPGAAPVRVWLVLDGWQWAVRVGLGRVGGQLIPVDWTKAEELLRDARPRPDQTDMAQNAAGGVA